MCVCVCVFGEILGSVLFKLKTCPDITIRKCVCILKNRDEMSGECAACLCFPPLNLDLDCV